MEVHLDSPHNHETSNCRRFPPPCLCLLRISRQDIHPLRRGRWSCPPSETRCTSIRPTCPCPLPPSAPPRTQGPGWTCLHLCQDRSPGQLQVGSEAQGWSTIWKIDKKVKDQRSHKNLKIREVVYKSLR